MVRNHTRAEKMAVKTVKYGKMTGQPIKTGKMTENTVPFLNNVGKNTSYSQNI